MTIMYIMLGSFFTCLGLTCLIAFFGLVLDIDVLMKIATVTAVLTATVAILSLVLFGIHIVLKGIGSIPE